MFFISKKYGQLSQCAINGSYDVPATESTTAATVSSKSATISTSTKAPWNAKAIAQWTEMVKSGDLTICGASGIPNVRTRSVSRCGWRFRQYIFPGGYMGQSSRLGSGKFMEEVLKLLSRSRSEFAYTFTVRKQ